MRAPRLRRGGVVVVTTALLVAAGCSATGEPAEPPEHPEAAQLRAATATLMQYTHDEVNRVLVVKLHNGSAEDTVSLDSVEVEAPGFDNLDRLDVTANIAAGRTLDLRLPYGELNCDVSVDGAVVLRLGLPDASGTVDLVNPDGTGLLRRIHDDECSAARLREATLLRWDDRWRRTGSGEALVVHGTLHVGPVAAGTDARLLGVEDTVLFDARSPALPRALGGGDAFTVDVGFVPTRCDAHALGESPQGFQIAARLRAPGAASDGTDDVFVPLVPDKAAQDVLTQGWLEQCGFR